MCLVSCLTPSLRERCTLAYQTPAHCPATPDGRCATFSRWLPSNGSVWFVLASVVVLCGQWSWETLLRQHIIFSCSVPARSKQWRNYKVVCLRVMTRNGVQNAMHSLVLEVDLGDDPDSLLPSEMPPSLGWEKNERGKMGPRMVNLSANMDPTK